MSLFAKNILGAIGHSGASIERLFSKLKLIRNDKRKCLAIESCDALLLTEAHFEFINFEV